MPEDEVLHCYRHPNVETTLRCYRCNNPICTKCAIRTPVGYLCPDCAHNIKQRYANATTGDYVITAVVSLVLGGLAGWLPITGWITVLLSPMAGTLIASLVNKLIKHHYGEWIWLIVALGIGLGGLPYAGTLLLPLLGGYSPSWFGLLWWAVHQALAISSAIAILRLE